MKKVTLFMMVALVAAVSFVSCKKGDDGATGAAGETGATGATGATGTKGDSGTANVIYSGWLTPNLYGDVTSSGDSVYFSTFDVPELTAEVASNAVVKVYVNLNTDADPVIRDVESAGLLMAFGTGFIQIYSYDYTFSGSFRYVIIPGGTLSTGTAEKTKIDWKDYKAVKAYLHLKD